MTHLITGLVTGILCFIAFYIGWKEGKKAVLKAIIDIDSYTYGKQNEEEVAMEIEAKINEWLQGNNLEPWTTVRVLDIRKKDGCSVTLNYSKGGIEDPDEEGRGLEYPEKLHLYYYNNPGRIKSEYELGYGEIEEQASKAANIIADITALWYEKEIVWSDVNLPF